MASQLCEDPPVLIDRHVSSHGLDSVPSFESLLSNHSSLSFVYLDARSLLGIHLVVVVRNVLLIVSIDAVINHCVCKIHSFIHLQSPFHEDELN